MQGGVLSKVNTSKTTIEYDMSYILSNSTIEVLSHGAYGFACKVTMKDGFVSGFIDEDGTPVTTFIIKLVPLEMLMVHKDGKWSRSSTMEKFTIEVSLQRKVYKESLRKHAYAPCPALLHHLVYTVGKLETLLPGEFSYGFAEDGEIIETENKTLRVGVIFMEFSSSPQGPTLYDAVKRGDITLEEKQGEATRLYCMALECGVNHRDAHTNNFLIDDKGRLKLIDFGIAKTLTEKEKEVVPLIPFIATDDCEELRDALEDLYKKDAWFLREPFSIDSYTTKVAKEAVRGSTEGLREIIPQVDTRKRRSEVEKIRMDTKAQKTTVREPTRKEGHEERLQRLEREANWPTKPKEGYEERLQRLEREDAEGTTEQDRRWARELEEERRVKRRSRAIRILLHDHGHRQLIKRMSDEELEDLIEEAMSELRKDESSSSGGRKAKTRRKRRTSRNQL